MKKLLSTLIASSFFLTASVDARMIKETLRSDSLFTEEIAPANGPTPYVDMTFNPAQIPDTSWRRVTAQRGNFDLLNSKGEMEARFYFKPITMTDFGFAPREFDVGVSGDYARCAHGFVQYREESYEGFVCVVKTDTGLMRVVFTDDRNPDVLYDKEDRVIMVPGYYLTANRESPYFFDIHITDMCSPYESKKCPGDKATRTTVKKLNF